MTRLLIVSNGHGEDTIGARLAVRLRTLVPELELSAFPLVGTGERYQAEGVHVEGPRRRLPAEGLTMHHPQLLWRDLRAGVVGLTVRQMVWLRRARPDAVLVVGDAFAQALASLVPAPRRVLQPLVSVHHGVGAPRPPLARTFMERILAPERLLMQRADRVYTRDAPTAAHLSELGVAHATYLGNPMMDDLAAEPLDLPGDGPVVALLPGSRDYARHSVRTMLVALARLGRVRGLVAWALSDLPELPQGWRADDTTQPPSASAVWRAGETSVTWLCGRFAEVLASADAAIGTAGTANEQAAGLGIPVVAFAVPPAYGEAFVANQARLLGGALRVVAAEPERIADALRSALSDGDHRDAARTVGPARMGGPGGGDAIAADVAAWLTQAFADEPTV
ncbi:MAG: lipid-A-disaccharide synthase-related protein [Trueperaceae bacterium]